MNKPLVTIIIPTWNNEQYLRPCVTSILRNRATPGLFKILVVNNGHENSCDYLINQSTDLEVINAGDNLGWEGGIDFGLKHTDSEFVVFMNDDTVVPVTSRAWINQLLQHFRDPSVGAVGPSSNTVMGWQNMFVDTPFQVFTTKFIIGFCAMIRRKSFEEIGGMDLSLPGGDDLDWSIRIRDKGYKILIDRTVFIYHHGFKTGERLNGSASVTNGWNSFEMYHKVNTALIKKHGLKIWWDMMKGAWEPPKTGVVETVSDSEGKKIKALIKKDEKIILDIGCGPRKTLKRAIGVDFVKKGERIPTLDGDLRSDADVEADVSKDLPFETDSVDVIIARHILEHMIDPISALINWSSKLKKGGRLMIAVPNEEWHLTVPMNIEHVHAYTPQSMAVLLIALGLTNIEMHSSENSVGFIAVATKQ